MCASSNVLVRTPIRRNLWATSRAICAEPPTPRRPFSTDLPDAVDVLVVNAVEAEMLGGGAVTTLDQALAAAKALTAQFRAVLVTAGGDGVAFADREGAEIRVPAVPVVVASTHGAGDAFVGTLAASLARGDEIRTAIQTAN